MRVAIDVIDRVESATIHQVFDPISDLILFPHLMYPGTLTENRADRHSRVQRSVRILEYDLHPFAQISQGGPLGGTDILTIENDCALGRFDQSQDRPSDRRLATTRFTDQAKGLSSTYLEAHSIDRLHVGGNPRENTASYWKPGPKISNL